jgi:hypothetical protein
MYGKGLRDPRSYDRRARHRVDLKVPVQFCRGAVGEVAGEWSMTGQTSNLSTGGVYLTTGEEGPFVPGEMLTMSVAIPWQLRRTFPFSRIVGSCQVIRAEEFPDAVPKRQWGLALEFCGNRPTMLGAIVT